MKKIVLLLIGLLALFTIIRAYAQSGTVTATGQGSRFLLHPGVLELQDGDSGLRVAFGLLEGEGKQTRIWNLFPITVSLRSGEKQISLSLNGLSFLTRSGIRFGRPLTVRGVYQGDVISIGGEVTVEGTVEGDIWTLGSGINLLPGATVTGNVVALGGRINADRKALIKGNKDALPQLKIPFIGLLASGHSAATLQFIIEMLGIFLLLLLLFFLVHYGQKPLLGIEEALSAQWKQSLLYLALTALILPLIVLLLAASIAGILLLPLVFVLLILLGFLGLLAVAVRLGLWLRGAKEGSAFFLYTSGLLGLLVIKGPVLIGILLSLLTSELLAGIGRFLASLGTALLVTAYLYGLGGTLRYLRMQSSRQ